MKKALYIFIFCLLCHAVHAQIQGSVVGEHKEPLVGATVLLLPDSLYQATDANGKFSFPNVQLKQGLSLEVTYLGYVTKVIDWNENASTTRIQLEEEGILLNSIVVEDEHAKQERTLSGAHIGEGFMDENVQGTFAKSIEKLPGINAINVGVGIAKPVIRGLSSNRIIVNQQGIKQESHQWGADHGLEVDQFDVERVEIIKGPATLQYGSDGLGGVINILPGKIAPLNSMVGSVEGVFKTNNDHIGGSAYFAANRNDFFVSARYSRQDFGDYRVPADQFVYNTYTLPIVNNTLKNTAGEEENFRITFGKKSKHSISRVLIGQYNLKAGLFSGAVGIPRSYALTDDGNSRDIDVPSQSVSHLRASFHQTFFWKDNHLNINVGYQKNLRQEFSFPEFHNIPASQLDFDDNLALQFDLQTLSSNIHYEHIFENELKYIVGGNLQKQVNQRAGFEFLLPNFETLRTGLFNIMEWSAKDDLVINGGLRLDYAANDTENNKQYIWNSNELIIDSLVVPTTNPRYFNWSASIGANWHMTENLLLRGNFGKSFRVPYPAETVSNGIHHGTFRHEVGTPGLKSEHGYQLDASIDWFLDKVTGGFATYFNYFQDYIYLGPTFPAQFSTLPEAGQIFQYRQDDAIYTGFELNWEWAINPQFSFTQTADFVQSWNLNTGLALPFTPQPTLKNNLRYDIKEFKNVSDFYVDVEYQYVFAAEGYFRIDRTEQETPAYQLWNVGAGMDLKIKGQPLQVNLQIQNLFDTFYLNHLSRYRLINVPEQGRNFVLSVKVPFAGNFKVGK